MSYTRLGIVEQKVDLYELEAESWKPDHDKAILCFDVEELISDGIHLFGSISRLDEDWKDFAFTYPDDYHPEIYDKILSLFRKWHAVSMQTLSIFEKIQDEHEGRDFDLTTVRQLKSNCEEAHRIISGFGDIVPDGLVSLQDSAINEFREGESVEMKVFGD